MKTHLNQENSFLRKPRCLPGITEIALKALNTLNVRSTEKFPRLTNSVTYLQERKVSSYITKAAIRKTDSKDNIKINTVLHRYSRHDNDAEIQPVPGIP